MPSITAATAWQPSRFFAFQGTLGAHMGEGEGVTVTCPMATAECPPQDASAASGEVYRGVRQNPPSDADLATAAQQGAFVGQDECQRCGLSVFKTADALRHAQDLLPTVGKLVARASLRPEHGYLKHTPSRKNPPHHTFWVADGIVRTDLFEVVEDRSK